MNRIYILESNGLYKIGVSANVDKRVKGLQTGNPHPIECVFDRKMTRAYEMEKKLHDVSSDFRVSGEWFKFSAEHLDLLKDHIIYHMRVCDLYQRDIKRVARLNIFINGLYGCPKCGH